MISPILLSGVDAHCAERIAEKCSPQNIKISNAEKTVDLIDTIQFQQPAMLIMEVQSSKNDAELSSVRQIRSKGMRLPIVLIHRSGCEDYAIEAFRAGIDDYIKKPLSYRQLFDSMDRILKNISVSPKPNSPSAVDKQMNMIGESVVMRGLKSYLVRVAGKTSTVLLTGETGTGKEMAAAMLHRHSQRSAKPFVCLNCAALPENLVESELFGHKKGTFTGAVADKKGIFESASGGTLFLDEIGDMSPASQAKVLRCIETKTVYPLGSHSATQTDIRLVAATNKDPEDLVRKGTFRADLYYRLNVARIHLPPLRERKEDIPHLADHAIQRLNQQFDSQISGISNEAMTALLFHQWPGNVRELNNTLESAFINCRSKTIEFTDIPQSFTKRLNFAENTTVERDKLLTALVASDWNKTAAAKKLNWSRMRVYRALKRYNLAAA